MNRFRRSFSLFLVFVLSFYIVPKEFIHELYGHTDTTDCVSSDSSSKAAPFTLSSKHVHCEVLNFESNLFNTPDTCAAISIQSLYFRHPIQNLSPERNTVSVFVSLRGPPLC